MSPTILQSGDLHINTTYYGGINPLTGIDREWESNLAAITSIVDHALEHGVDAVMLNGDQFNNGRPPYEAVLLLAAALRPLAENGVPLIILKGNHEIQLVQSAHRTPTVVLGELLSGMSPKAEVHVVEREPRLITTSTGVQAVCLPWLSKATVLTDLGSDNTDPWASEKLVVSEALRHIERLVGQADSGAPLVFASHLTVDDVRIDTDTGINRRGAEMKMSPNLFQEHVMPRKKLEEFGFAYGGLSHIHLRQRLSDTFYYPGSTNRHTIDDADRPKSVNLVELIAPGRAKVSHLPVAARPMTSITLDADDAGTRLSELEPGTLVQLYLEPGQSDADKKILSQIAAAGARVIKTQPAGCTPTKVQIAAASLPENIDPMTALKKWLDQRTDDVDRVVKTAHEIVGGDK